MGGRVTEGNGNSAFLISIVKRIKKWVELKLRWIKDDRMVA
jgi:hypothetical protein